MCVVCSHELQVLRVSDEGPHVQRHAVNQDCSFCVGCLMSAWSERGERPLRRCRSVKRHLESKGHKTLKFHSVVVCVERYQGTLITRCKCGKVPLNRQKEPWVPFHVNDCRVKSVLYPFEVGTYKLANKVLLRPPVELSWDLVKISPRFSMGTCTPWRHQKSFSTQMGDTDSSFCHQWRHTSTFCTLCTS